MVPPVRGRAQSDLRTTCSRDHVRWSSRRPPIRPWRPSERACRADRRGRRHQQGLGAHAALEGLHNWGAALLPCESPETVRRGVRDVSGIDAVQRLLSDTFLSFKFEHLQAWSVNVLQREQRGGVVVVRVQVTTSAACTRTPQFQADCSKAHVEGKSRNEHVGVRRQ